MPGRVLHAYQKHDYCHPVTFDGWQVRSRSVSVFNCLDKIPEKPTRPLSRSLTYIKWHKRETFSTFYGNRVILLTKAGRGPPFPGSVG
jgi:hypothetical protein